MREYLRTSWSPDREYVELAIERETGEKEHSIIQRFLTFFLRSSVFNGVEVFP